MTNDKNIGSSFDEFMQEELILEEAIEVAIERIAVWLSAEALKVLHQIADQSTNASIFYGRCTFLPARE